jgi:hypothetical protein
MEEMASQLQNMLCIWLMKNYQIKTNVREIVFKVLDTNPITGTVDVARKVREIDFLIALLKLFL